MEISRLFDYIHKQFDDGPVDRFIGTIKEGQWKFYSTSDVISMSRKLASGLINAGINPGDKIGIVVYQNRQEWVIVDLAIQYIGAISVPMYPTISSREYKYIMNEAEVKICFVGSGDLYEKVNTAKQDVPSLQKILTFDDPKSPLYWEKLFDESNLEKVESISNTISSEDLVTIIYTSGTTGNPKGVMLTHHNIISNVEACIDYIPVKRGEKVLSFLPLCHIFERAVLYVYMRAGVEIYFTGTNNLGGETGDLMQVKPHYFTTVPRLLEKVYEKIYNKGLELKGIKRALFFWALRLTDKFEFNKKFSFSQKISFNIADKLIFSKWRAALGSNVKAVATGAAACPAKIARVFSAAGIIITEGYGLTETSPVISLNRYNDRKIRIGSVGLPLENVEVIIDNSDGNYRPEEGEILVKGPNVMQGYYKQPQLTADVFKELNGKQFFKTGDVGKLSSDGFLIITDRKKELLKTSGGKYIAPAPIENKLKEEFLIEQAMIVGDQMKFTSALIIPSIDTLKNWCELHDIVWSTPEIMVKNTEVLNKYQNIINKINQDLNHIEQIKKFVLLDSSWDPIKADGSEGELTPTLKLKRRVILEKYKALIDEMYLENAK
ncbi:MAG: long-chain fatty acid--CoA ligase [Saprospiraceae bacterium]